MLTKDIKAHLDALEKESEELIAAVNDDIALGVNKSLNIKNWHKREWTLPYIKSDVEVNNPFFESSDILPPLNRARARF